MAGNLTNVHQRFGVLSWATITLNPVKVWCCGAVQNCVLLGRLPKVDLIILDGGKMSVRTSVHTYVRPSVHKKILPVE